MRMSAWMLMLLGCYPETNVGERDAVVVVVAAVVGRCKGWHRHQDRTAILCVGRIKRGMAAAHHKKEGYRRKVVGQFVEYDKHDKANKSCGPCLEALSCGYDHHRNRNPLFPHSPSSPVSSIHNPTACVQ